jgi:3-hydroxyisobutyrate dehydrogenase-like beta-hydroxyacid dehydrogenase
MSDVSVIGTGVMGSALVEALAASGADVTVWNRTKEKAEALSGPRVRLAESVAEALRMSPLTIVSVSDHELARTLVEAAGADLQGRWWPPPALRSRIRPRPSMPS